MVFYLKKIAGVFCVVIVSTVYAGTMGASCTPYQATIPCDQHGWGFAGQALYLRPNYSGMDYWGVIFNSTVTGDPSSLAYLGQSSQWGWGLQIEASYRYRLGNDININWYHFNNATKHSVGVPSESTFADNVNNDYNETVSRRLRPYWDAINFEFAQYVNFGERDALRLFAGFDFSRINTKIDYFAMDSTYTRSSEQNLVFNGFGPRIGLDLSYNLLDALAIYAKGATSLLVGPSRFIDKGKGPVVSTWHYQGGASTALVPELELKLGGQYAIQLYKHPLLVNVGWMWLNYFNALRNSNGLDNSYGINQSDFGLQGLFLGLKYLL